MKSFTIKMDDLDLNKIRTHLNTGFTGKNIVYFKEIDSTNDYAFELLEEHRKTKKQDCIEKLNGTLIVSETQRKGRGKQNRNWVSPPGGLWFTIILVSSLDLKDLQKITLISAFAVASVLNDDFGIGVKIKWPNDIYYKEKKVGGILVESEKSDNMIFLISGFGLNVNFGGDVSFPDSVKAVSLKQITGADIDRETLLCSILESFEHNYIAYTDEKKFSDIFKKMERFMTY